MTLFIERVRDKIYSSVPASTIIVNELFQLLGSQKSNTMSIAKVIENDPPLTAKIIQIANSAYYGSTKGITSLQRAIVVLGFNTIREIATTISVIDLFKATQNQNSEVILNIWYHSIGTAKACELLANKTRLVPPEIAYTSGLLHDIGKIFLLVFFPDEYMAVIDYTKKVNTRIILVERNKLKVDHTVVGYMVSDQLRLPEEIKQVIRFHHEPNELPASYQRLARIVELGNYIWKSTHMGDIIDESLKSPSIASLKLLGNDQIKIDSVLDDMKKELIDSQQEITNYFGNK